MALNLFTFGLCLMIASAEEQVEQTNLRVSSQSIEDCMKCVSDEELMWCPLKADFSKGMCFSQQKADAKDL